MNGHIPKGQATAILAETAAPAKEPNEHRTITVAFPFVVKQVGPNEIEITVPRLEGDSLLTSRAHSYLTAGISDADADTLLLRIEQLALAESIRAKIVVR